MERVGVRELRQHLSRWLRRVEGGEAFEVTERGQPVALLVPIARPGGALRRLAAAGRLGHVGTGLGELGPPRRRAREPLSAVLDELRGER